MARFCFLILFLFLTNSFISGVYSSATFTLLNKCSFTVWPGILTNAGVAPLPTTGFVLQSGESKTINAPSAWGGRFWGRSHCSQDSAGKFSCATGDCGSGKLECAGSGATPPATLAEFTLDGASGMDFYDVSLVDGYNLPMLVVPQGGTGVNCSKTGCLVDLNDSCPSELRVAGTGGERIACMSPCQVYRVDIYCCTGAFGTPDVCKPTYYSMAFKKACPHAYSYAYDDRASTFTCAGADYIITFCPAPNTSQKSSGEPNPVSDSNSNPDGNSNRKSPIDSNMVYEGALNENGAPSTSTHLLGGAIAVIVALWKLCHLF